MKYVSHKSTCRQEFITSDYTSLTVDKIYCKDSDQRRFIITGYYADDTTVQLYKHGPTSSGTWGTTNIANISVDLTDIEWVKVESGAASYGNNSTPFQITNMVFS